MVVHLPLEANHMLSKLGLHHECFCWILKDKEVTTVDAHDVNKIKNGICGNIRKCIDISRSVSLEMTLTMKNEALQHLLKTVEELDIPFPQRLTSCNSIFGHPQHTP